LVKKTSSSSSSAVPRRARQTKTPRKNISDSLQSSTKSVNKSWNIQSQSPPHRSLTNADAPVYRVSHIYDAGTFITSSASVPVLLAQNFQITSMPNISSYQAIFDQYRITRIECWIEATQTNTGGHSGKLLSVVDFDDSNAVGSLAAMQEYPAVIEGFSSTLGHYHSWQPHVAIGAYGGGVFASYANEASPWIDLGSITVEHYGLKLATNVHTDVISFGGLVRMWAEFRCVR
jgi:hypothetical protein